jgi:hypothetical protein
MRWEGSMSKVKRRKWVRRVEIMSAEEPADALTKAERGELVRLRPAHRQLQVVREILTKGAVFFAKESE